jgi:hypothetical protein
MEEFGIDECEDVVSQCVTQPEALVGWRVFVDSMGEGLVVGIKRRLGRSTRHIICWSDDDQLPATIAAPVPRRSSSLRSGSSEFRSEASSAVVLRRKASHKRRCYGLAFEVLSKEF